MKLDVLKKDGTKSGESVTLAPEIFEIAPNDHAIYMAVRSYMANQRQGTSRSPIQIGGGTIFGPHPHDYVVKLPAKVKKLARKSVLSYKAKEANIVVVEDFSFEAPKTKDMETVLKALRVQGKKVLFLVPKHDSNILKSGRNIPRLQILEAAKASTYEIADSAVLVLQKSSVDIVEKTFAN